MENKKKLTIALPRRIDSTNAETVSGELNAAIAAGDATNGIVMDADGLDYISSAGLRVLLALKKKYADLYVINVSRDVYEIFETTGFDQILDARKKKRTVSVDGCEVIGKGYCGTVYRLDPETIIKVYHGATEETLADIENEKNMAKLALVGGIPTAISYDIVRVGDSYGSVFELLNAVTFNDLVIKNPENLDAITRQYVDFLKLVHGTEINNPLLSPAKTKFFGYLEAIRKTIGESLYTDLKKLIESVKDSHYVVHGDPQMKNIMLVNGEPMLIDMDTLCAGEPIFDLQAIYVTYVAYSEDDPGNPMSFLGISLETAGQIWEKVFDYYFADGYSGDKNAALHKIQLLAYIRFLFLIVTSDTADEPLGKLRIEHATQKLTELSAQCMDLNL